jgi:hypothetical protein
MCKGLGSRRGAAIGSSRSSLSEWISSSSKCANLHASSKRDNTLGKESTSFFVMVFALSYCVPSSCSFFVAMRRSLQKTCETLSSLVDHD